jgi:CRP-like cAMP-binding protein
VLQTGQVRIQRNWQGNAIKLGSLGPGDCFGEMALIDFQKRSATVIAELPCQAISVPAAALGLLYRQDVEQYAIIMMNLGREVSRRLRLADNRLFELVHRHGEQDTTTGIADV